MAYHGLSRVLVGVTVLVAATAGLACGARADALERSGQRLPKPDLEIWSGAEAFEAVWSAYSGASWAPFGSVREDGLRLRAVLGAGAYHGGKLAFGDVLIGYHKQLGPVTLKVLGGLTVAERWPTEPTSLASGTAIGPKAVLETWWTIADRAWASADLSVAVPHLHMAETGDDSSRADYNGRIRLGWRLWPELSVGFEGGAGGPMAPTLQTTLQNGLPRAGGFLRYEWAGGEASISAGAFVGGDEREGHVHPFATVSVLTRF